MRESCLVYCYSGIQSLFEVVLLYTFYTPLNLPINLNPEYLGLASEISFPHYDAWFYRIGSRAIYFIQNFST